MTDAISGAATVTTSVRMPVHVAACFGNSSVRILVTAIDGSSERLLDYPHPHPAEWGSAWLAAGAEKPSPQSLRTHFLSLLDAAQVTVRSLVLVVSGRVIHSEGKVDVSFLLGPAFSSFALSEYMRGALPRVRPAGIALLNDTACSAIQGYLALSKESATSGSPPLFPTLVVDAGTGCSFAYVHLCTGNRVRIVLLEPWASREAQVHAIFPPPTAGQPPSAGPVPELPSAANTTGPATLPALVETMPLWRIAGDAALREHGAATWNVRLQFALDAVQRFLKDAAGGESPLRSVFFAGGNSAVVYRAAAEAAAPGLHVRGLPSAGEAAPTREEVRLRYLRAALAAVSVGHLLDIHNIGEELTLGGIKLF